MDSLTLREGIITGYFNSWLDRDVSVLENTFSAHAVYIESWGPAYRGLAEITQWFIEWNKNNAVLQWDIARFTHQGNTCVCEWYFKCDCDNEVSDFNGVSVIDFDDGGKIALLKEFQSKLPNYYPFQKGL